MIGYLQLLNANSIVGIPQAAIDVASQVLDTFQKFPQGKLNHYSAPATST